MGRPKNNQVWNHYRNGANKSVICKHCNINYKIANVNRMLTHLKKCCLCPPDIKEKLDSPQSQILLRHDSITPTNFDEDSSTEPVNVVFSKEDIDKQLINAILVTGTPFSLVEHPLWKKLFELLHPTYRPPTRKTLSTTLLDKSYNDMNKIIQSKIKESPCLHLQCDGWSNLRNEGIVNFLFSTPEPIFIKSLDTSTNRHTGEYIAEQIIDLINTYNSQKFFVLIGDNAANMQKAFRLVKVQYPHVVPLGCVAHTLNLLCNDVLENQSIIIVTNMVIRIIKKIRLSQILRALFAQIMKDKNYGGELKLPCQTRWGSYFNSFQSIKNSKSTLQTLVVHEDADFDLETKQVLLGEDFWMWIDQILDILGPITKWIWKLEGDNSSIQLVHSAFRDLRSNLHMALPLNTIIEDVEKENLLSSFEARVQKAIKPIHLAACLLNPYSQGNHLTESETADAMEFVFEMSQEMNLQVLSELANYRAKHGLWAKRFIWESIEEKKISAVTWWKGLCGSTELSVVATRILTAPCTTAATERSFSVQSFIHSKIRNRITTQRAGKSTFVSYNWKLINKYMDDDNDNQEEKNATPESDPLNIDEPSTSAQGFEPDFVESETESD